MVPSHIARGYERLLAPKPSDGLSLQFLLSNGHFCWTNVMVLTTVGASMVLLQLNQQDEDFCAQQLQHDG